MIEDTPVSAQDITDLFGAEISELVEGVTKLTKLELNSEHTKQAENLRKFILAISKDVRVLMVKLADRLHNMRTLHYIKSPAKRERIARETLDIYAPLARSIGCHRICSELEELAFEHLNPVARDAIGRRLEALRIEQGGAVAVVSAEIAAKLEAGGLAARVFGREKIEELFGAEIAELVEGVTKLSKLELSQEHLRQAENLRKFILAISKDVRVLLVKLADRLHNMRTLHFIKQAAKRERIARETLDIYGPLARSIGVHRICEELEELAFAHLNPVARDAIMRRLAVLRAEQGGAVSTVSQEMSARLEAAGIPARVYGREKHPFSIWRKLQRKSIGFSQMSDIYAFRVIVDSEADCYRALGLIHRQWPCVPERFKDFISTPKRNNYRSLHTTVVGYKGMRIE
ncbi:MAG: HD domain-containing protein, partial [Phenylobacterium sp.]|nr:HD domain-containing protein [Phenylobacterium sp.]